MSVEHFSAFMSTVWQMLTRWYEWLSTITIAGISLFTWMIGLLCFGAIISVIKAFAGVGHVTMSGMGTGMYEASRIAYESKKRKR